MYRCKAYHIKAALHHGSPINQIIKIKKKDNNDNWRETSSPRRVLSQLNVQIEVVQSEGVKNSKNVMFTFW